MTKNTNRWGLAAGLAAALALHGTAGAQTGSSAAGSQPTTPSGAGSKSESGMGGREGTGSSTTGSPSSTGGATSRDADRSTGTATGSSAGQAQSGMAQKLDKGLQESLEKLHAANQAELHMAQMGQQNAQSPQVKEFAQKLGEDHQKLDEKLTTAAQGAGAASLEGKAFQKERDKATKDMDKLQKKTGAEFDKAYMDMMVKDHEKDLKNVKDAAKDARKHNHTELASLLEGAQTGMQGHLDHAKQIRDSLGQAQRQGRTGTPGAERSGAAGTGSAGQTDRAGPTGASPQGAGGPGTGSGASGSGSNPSLPDRSSPQPGGSPSDRATK